MNETAGGRKGKYCAYLQDCESDARLCVFTFLSRALTLDNPKARRFNTKGQLIKPNWLLRKDKLDLKHTHKQQYLSFILKVLSLSSDPEPRTLKAISSCLLSQFPVTAVILSLKKDGCSHNNLHGSYQTHHHCHCKKRKVFQSSDIYIFFPSLPSGGGVSPILADQGKKMICKKWSGKYDQKSLNLSRCKMKGKQEIWSKLQFIAYIHIPLNWYR